MSHAETALNAVTPLALFGRTRTWAPILFDQENHLCFGTPVTHGHFPTQR
jgi:hypothetical protein